MRLIDDFNLGNLLGVLDQSVTGRRLPALTSVVLGRLGFKNVELLRKLLHSLAPQLTDFGVQWYYQDVGQYV